MTSGNAGCGRFAGLGQMMVCSLVGALVCERADMWRVRPWRPLVVRFHCTWRNSSELSMTGNRRQLNSGLSRPWLDQVDAGWVGVIGNEARSDWQSQGGGPTAVSRVCVARGTACFRSCCNESEQGSRRPGGLRRSSVGLRHGHRRRCSDISQRCILRVFGVPRPSPSRSLAGPGSRPRSTGSSGFFASSVAADGFVSIQ